MDMIAAHQRTMKEFLELYNKITYHCFERCISNFNHAKASGDEMNCIDTCTNKYINFNQRHMMMFVEHQNNKQKLAAQAAAESQASLQTPAPSSAGESNSQGQATPPEQGSSPLVQPATSVEAATTNLPQNVCYVHTKSRLVNLFTILQPKMLTDYSGKSVVDQFLNSGAADSKSV